MKKLILVMSDNPMTPHSEFRPLKALNPLLRNHLYWPTQSYKMTSTLYYNFLLIHDHQHKAEIEEATP